MNRWLIMPSAILVAALVLPVAAETQVQPEPPQQPTYGAPGDQRYLPPPFPRQPPRRGLRLERDMNEAGYELRIFTGEEEPQSFQVEVQGRSILITRSQSEQTRQSSDRGSYSLSRSFSNFRRRVSLPRDADGENMQRVDGDGLITITLPRRDEYTAAPEGFGEGRSFGRGGYPGFGPGYDPAFAPGPGFPPGYGPGYGPGYDPAYGPGFAPDTGQGDAEGGYGYAPPPVPTGAPEYTPGAESSPRPAPLEAPPAAALDASPTAPVVAPPTTPLEEPTQTP